jgi:FAD:protein FMN transferase
MQEIRFERIGTHWSISIDRNTHDPEIEPAILNWLGIFEAKFSRFKSTSEVNSFRESSAGEYRITEEFAHLLIRADELRTYTDGVYDPAVATLLEKAGYDAGYRLKADEAAVRSHKMPKWNVRGTTLSISGPTAFDLGGIGKGYAIDRVADIIKGMGNPHYLVEGGGDMAGTDKQDGSAWRVAVEWPNKPDTAAGVVELRGQGFAASDSFRRRWGKWHHLVNAKEKTPVDHIAGCAVVAGNAWDADSMTSALCFATSDKWPLIARHFHASYIVFGNDGKVDVSPNWKGELFV